MKIKPKLKVIIPVAAVLILGVVGVNAVRSVGAKPTAAIVNTYAVEKTTLSSTVSVTGMVESGNKSEVYNTLTYPVKTVSVEVGDVVAEGDTLCMLDTADLQANIAQKSASLSNTQAKANFGVAVAEKERETALFNNEKDYNSTLLSAEAAVKTAENALEAAEHNLKSARKDLESALNNELTMETNGSTTTVSVDTVMDGYRLKVTTAEIAVEGARQTLEAAEASLRAVKMQEKETVITKEEAVTNAQLNADFTAQQLELQKMRQDLADANIKAPISGTVTAVFAKEGAAGTGLMFVIEDTTALKVSTKIKEYDIGVIQVGMPVTIQADATGEEKFAGEVSMISPTTVKDATTGETKDTTSAEFEAEVNVTSESALRIGMNTRMNILTQHKEDVLSVPIEALATDSEGRDIVYVYRVQEDGTAIAQAAPVEIGMETDIACEITSADLTEGAEIILAPEGVTDGAQVMKASNSAASGQSGGETAMAGAAMA